MADTRIPLPQPSSPAEKAAGLLPPVAANGLRAVVVGLMVVASAALAEQKARGGAGAMAGQMVTWILVGYWGLWLGARVRERRTGWYPAVVVAGAVCAAVATLLLTRGDGFGIGSHPLAPLLRGGVFALWGGMVAGYLFGFPRRLAHPTRRHIHPLLIAALLLAVWWFGPRPSVAASTAPWFAALCVAWWLFRGGSGSR